MHKIAIISDIHSNLEALDTVLNDIKKRKIKRILCAGDIIGYNANPNECCALIKKLKIQTVQGNHDLGINLKNLEWFNPYARKALIWTASKLDKKHSRWLLNLPKIYSKKILEKTIYMVHGSPANPLWEHIMPYTSLSVLKNFFKKTKADVLIFGHTHITFIKKINEKLAINAGSIGQPRDGNLKACYVILDIKEMKAEIIRLKYNIKKTADKIYKAGLPKFLADRLFAGI